MVTYRYCVKISEGALQQLTDFNIDVELIEVQILTPFSTRCCVTRAQEGLISNSRLAIFSHGVVSSILYTEMGK